MVFLFSTECGTVQMFFHVCSWNGHPSYGTADVILWHHTLTLFYLSIRCPLHNSDNYQTHTYHMQRSRKNMPAHLPAFTNMVILTSIHFSSKLTVLWQPSEVVNVSLQTVLVLKPLLLGSQESWIALRATLPNFIIYYTITKVDYLQEVKLTSGCLGDILPSKVSVVSFFSISGLHYTSTRYSGTCGASCSIWTSSKVVLSG